MARAKRPYQVSITPSVMEALQAHSRATATPASQLVEHLIRDHLRLERSPCAKFIDLARPQAAQP